ncbi:MAG: hypothetical protein DRN15_04600 [Thermoprotei archaeon]|nr:MAG: hypothetical protein DRN15_04600 [Thermoprotei archaeon]RLF25899.1 MAG: hypothetical protein DRM97_00230 [Thermoprotei archaeon]
MTTGVLMIELIPERAAMIIESGSELNLVIADLHIGYEATLGDKGINLPSQVRRLLMNITALIIEYQPDRLILLGDIKHQVPGITELEVKDVPFFFKELLKMNLRQILIVPGNHDGRINEIIPRDDRLLIAPSRGIMLEDGNLSLGLLHGHTWPSIDLLNADILVMGHTHPVIELRDSLGYRYLEPVWVKAPIVKEKLIEAYSKRKEEVEEISLRSVIVMPAFNRLLGGNVLNRADTPRPLLGPLPESGALDIGCSEVFLLDGTYLGTLNHLRAISTMKTSYEPS